MGVAMVYVATDESFVGSSVITADFLFDDFPFFGVGLASSSATTASNACACAFQLASFILEHERAYKYA